MSLAGGHRRAAQTDQPPDARPGAARGPDPRINTRDLAEPISLDVQAGLGSPTVRCTVQHREREHNDAVGYRARASADVVAEHNTALVHLQRLPGL